MAKSFSNWKDIEVYLRKHIDDTLNNEVAKSVKEQVMVAVDEAVYQSGSPAVYKRRGGNDYGGMGNPIGSGSLADQNQMNHIVNNGELVVTNDAERNKDYKFAGIGYDTNKSLTENIVEGYGDRSRWYNQPRDFMEEARENLRRDKYHVEAMKIGLKKRGLEVL